jgi:hypothetical protein
VEMLFRTNLVALVGGGAHPKFPANKVMLWDDSQGKCIGELGVKTNIANVRLRKDKIAMILPNKIIIYNFTDLKLLDGWETNYPNPNGLCALAPSGDAIIIYPDVKAGLVKIKNCGKLAKQVRRQQQNSRDQCTVPRERTQLHWNII